MWRKRRCRVEQQQDNPKTCKIYTFWVSKFRQMIGRKSRIIAIGCYDAFFMPDDCNLWRWIGVSFENLPIISKGIFHGCTSLMTRLNVQSFAQCKRLHILVSASSWRHICGGKASITRQHQWSCNLSSWLPLPVVNEVCELRLWWRKWTKLRVPLSFTTTTSICKSSFNRIVATLQWQIHSRWKSGMWNSLAHLRETAQLVSSYDSVNVLYVWSSSKCNHKCCMSSVANVALAGLELDHRWRMYDWLRGMTRELWQVGDERTASKTLSCIVDYDGDRTVPEESRFATSVACSIVSPNPLEYVHQTKCCDYIIQLFVATCS